MITNRKLLFPYAAPFLAYVFIASALGDYLSVEINYILRGVVCTSLLIWARKWYMDLTGSGSLLTSVATGTAVGLAGVVLWIVLLSPFAPPVEDASWSISAFILRLIAASLLVPVFEEIMMRGFVLRFAYQWWEAKKSGDEEALQAALDERSVNDVIPGAWSWPAVIISTLVFTSGHLVYEWPAAIAYGLLMAALWIVRKDLISCIVAHGVTNCALGLYVVKSGSWHLW